MSKMKKLRNHSQKKNRRNHLKQQKNETDLCNLIDTELKREGVKILKELKLNIKQ